MNRSEDNRSSVEDGPPHRSFLDRLSHAVLGEPASREDLIEILRDAGQRGLIDSDSLDMIEGVFQVSEMKVRDIMVPRAQMQVVDKNKPPESYLPMIIESGHSRFPTVDARSEEHTSELQSPDHLV